MMDSPVYHWNYNYQTIGNVWTSGGMASYCSCLKHEEFCVIWWSSCSAVIILPFLWMIMTSDWRAGNACFRQLFPVGNGDVCTRHIWSEFVFILSFLRESFAVMREWTGTKVLGWGMHGIPIFICEGYERRHLSCTLECGPLLAEKMK